MTTQLRQTYAGKEFVFQGIFDNNIEGAQIQALLPNFILTQFNQYQTQDDHRLATAEIQINDYAYIAGNPDKWFVVAKWQII